MFQSPIYFCHVLVLGCQETGEEVVQAYFGQNKLDLYVAEFILKTEFNESGIVV
jgi:hypothetical protein